MDVRHLHRACVIAIEDGDHIPRMGVKDLANQPGHTGERNAVHGNDLVFGPHAGALRFGHGLHQETRVAGVVKRRARAVGIEKLVEDRSRAGHIEEQGTYNQYGQQQIREFGVVGFHGPIGGMVADPGASRV